MTAPTTPPNPDNAGGPPAPGGGYAPPTPPPAPGYQAPPAAPGGWSAPPPPAPPAPPAPGGWSAPPPPAPGYDAPPAPGYDAPPAPGYGAQPPAWGGAPVSGKASFDPKTVNPLDWGILGAGALAFLFSLFGFYTAKSSITVGPLKQSTSESASAWHSIFGGGFFGWFAMVFALAGAVVLALHLFAPQIKIPVPLTPRQLVLTLFAAGALFEILAIFVHPTFASVKEEGFSASFGHGFSFWISLIVIIAGAVLAFLRLQQTGGSLPWEKNKTA